MSAHNLHPNPDSYDSKRFMFGNRWRFGIECDLEDCDLDPWGSREPYGSLWLWAAERLIGNPEVGEQLIHGFGPLETVAHSAGSRGASEVPGKTNLDKLDFIRWVDFGDDGDFDSARWGTRSIEELRQFDAKRFALFPISFSPFQDGWQAVLLDDGEQETLVWRKWRGVVDETHELSLPQAEFTSVIRRAADWFRNIRRTRVGTGKD